MKIKTLFKIRILPLFLFLGLMFSCSGQEKPIPPKEQSQNKEALSADNIMVPYPGSAPQIAEYIVEVFEDSKGRLWFGTMALGAAMYDGKTLSYISANEGLPGNTVASIREDQEGNIWFGTHNGASKYDGKVFTNYREKEGLLGPGCNIMIHGSGKVWAGTNAGLFYLNGSTFQKFDLPKPKIEHLTYHWEAGKVWAMLEDSKGNLWFGRDGYGACKYDGKTFTHFTKEDGLWSNNVNSIIEDKKGNIWITSITSSTPNDAKDGGVNYYDGNKLHSFPEVENLNHNRFYSIHEDKAGIIWIGAAGTGVFRYNGKHFTLVKETDRMDLTWSVALQGILEDSKGRLWLGFSGGLFRMKDSKIINVTQDGPWE